ARCAAAALFNEFLSLDDEALVSAFADERDFVKGLDVKDQPAAVNFAQGALKAHLHTDRGGRKMLDVDGCADCRHALVQHRLDALEADVFHKSNHHRGCENVKTAAFHVGRRHRGLDYGGQR